MKRRECIFATLLATCLSGVGIAKADPFPENASFSTLITTPLGIEGLTADEHKFYTVGRTAVVGGDCPVWQIDPDSPALVVVGFVPSPSPVTSCSPSGLAFDKHGDLFVADGSTIYSLTPNATTPPTATIFASGVPGTNGLAFDESGSLWTGDGTTGQGRVWKISTSGVVTEMFRIQPVRNSTALGGQVAGDGVGRQVRTFPPGTLANTAGEQSLVANGLAFNRSGDLFIGDTARGAIWKVEFRNNGDLKSPTGCDVTFTPNTLCLDAIYVSHPYLEGTDGIALDREGNIWSSANERNAIAIVLRKDREVREVFRNPVDPGTLLRNGGPLETPTSPFLLGKLFCTAQSDGNRRDNSPNTAGEIGGPGLPRGKISCIDQRLDISGLPLPVR